MKVLTPDEKLNMNNGMRFNAHPMPGVLPPGGSVPKPQDSMLKVLLRFMGTGGKSWRGAVRNTGGVALKELKDNVGLTAPSKFRITFNPLHMAGQFNPAIKENPLFKNLFTNPILNPGMQIKQASGFGDLFSKYIVPRAGLHYRAWKGTLGNLFGKTKSLFGGAKAPSMTEVHAPLAAEYRTLQSSFDQLPTWARLGYGAAKQGVGSALGVAALGTGGLMANGLMDGFKGTINDRRNEEIGKAVGGAREYVQRAFSDPSTRIKLGLGALFNPSAASGQIDEMIQGMGQNAMRQ